MTRLLYRFQFPLVCATLKRVISQRLNPFLEFHKANAQQIKRHRRPRFQGISEIQHRFFPLHYEFLVAGRSHRVSHLLHHIDAVPRSDFADSFHYLETVFGLVHYFVDGEKLMKNFLIGPQAVFNLTDLIGKVSFIPSSEITILILIE